MISARLPEERILDIFHELRDKQVSSGQYAHPEALIAGKIPGFEVAVTTHHVDARKKLEFDYQTVLSTQEIIDIPQIKSYISFEHDLRGFMEVYVQAHPIVTLYDLEVDVCKNFKIASFESYGQGRFVRHPFVKERFKVGVNVQDPMFITKDNVYESLFNHIKEHVDSYCASNAKVSRIEKSLVHACTLKAFQQCLEKHYKTPFSALGIIFNDFEYIVGEVKSKILESTRKGNNQLAKYTKEVEKIFRETVRVWEENKNRGWGEIVQKLARRYGVPESIEVLNSERYSSIFTRWNERCANKPFFVAISDMTVSLPSEYIREVIDLASLYVYLDTKRPLVTKRLDEYIPALALEDSRKLNLWAKRIKNGGWRFADMKK